ncbi:hypothetical protein SASPL_119558 [Salvia splendens]|uniref:Uncharacterized protein n=1 Tax=Salvia splendens TaxID=180675 RepID=A0A8X8ZUT1_SALSN|nr:hypothetical protein SASPL_119558 [Salvia splendens]
MTRIRRCIGHEHVLHLLDQIGEKQRRRWPPAVHVRSRHRRLHRHSFDGVPLDRDLIQLIEFPLHLHDLDPLIAAVLSTTVTPLITPFTDLSRINASPRKNVLVTAGELDVDPDAAESGGLVVAVDAGDQIRLAGEGDSSLRGEDDYVGADVVVSGEGDGGAGEEALAGIGAGGDVLSEVGGADDGLVAAFRED